MKAEAESGQDLLLSWAQGRREGPSLSAFCEEGTNPIHAWPIPLPDYSQTPPLTLSVGGRFQHVKGEDSAYSAMHC